MAQARPQAVSPIESTVTEQALLGAILIQGEIPASVAGLKPQDFHHETYGRVFRAMIEIQAHGKPVDLVTVASYLKERGQIESVGGYGFLVALTDEIPRAANAGHYAQIVIERAQRRELEAAAKRILSICQQSGQDMADLLQFAESQIFEVTQRREGKNFRARPEAILEISEFLKKDPPQRQTYLEPWLKEASINMITGWRGIGKTGFTMGLVSAAAGGKSSFGFWPVVTPVPSLYFDAEMTQQDTAERFGALYQGKTQEPLFVLSDHYCNLLGLPSTNLCDENWRTWLKDELVKRGIKLWVLDNIGAVTPGIDENSREDWSPINRWLLDLRFAGISTILLHHEGKAGSQRGTSAREDNLDMAISLKRPQDYRPEDGARFICHFEKARIRQAELHLIADTEFQMQQDPDGKTVWTWKNVRLENKARVLKMLDEGMSRKEIAGVLGISGPRVSQIKAEGMKDGLITEAGKLTQTGYTYFLKGAN